MHLKFHTKAPTQCLTKISIVSYLYHHNNFNPFTANPIKALHSERQSAQMSKLKNGGLDQFGAEPFKQQQFGTAGIEGVKESDICQLCPRKFVIFKKISSILMMWFFHWSLQCVY